MYRSTCFHIGQQPSDGIAPADSKRTLILSTVLPIVLLAAGAITGVGLLIRFLRRRPVMIPGTFVIG